MAFEMIQKRPVTNDLRGPYTLAIVYVAIDKKTTRKRFACCYKALQALKDAKLVGLANRLTARGRAHHRPTSAPGAGFPHRARGVLR